MSIQLETKYIAPADPSLPALVLQYTHLVNSCMIWVGTTDEPEENAHLAPMQGSLVRDWACAMPPLTVCCPIYRVNEST